MKIRYWIANEGQLFTTTNCILKDAEEITRYRYYKLKNFLKSL